MHFDGVRSPDESIERIAETKRLGRAAGRALQVWTPIGILCRPTRKEAQEYMQRIIEYADIGAVGHLAEMHERDAKERIDVEGIYRRTGESSTERRVLARGSYCAIGDPDTVAGHIARLAEVGFDGLVVNFVNYLDEFPYFVQEVLPRLERLGLREKALSAV
jgi:alkanesulfonate monooxygenase SsuD/methylene tetrahydromethanopterin reductase-like flavin-dependent oxidoreductase (luciferase family)